MIIPNPHNPWLVDEATGEQVRNDLFLAWEEGFVAGVNAERTKLVSTPVFFWNYEEQVHP